MSVIQKAKSHFKEALAGDNKSIEVPEWETTLYFTTVTTFAQEQNVVKLHQEGKITEALVETLISRALDKDGKKVFKGPDRVTLMNQADPAVMMRIITELNADNEELEDALGN